MTTEGPLAQDQLSTDRSAASPDGEAKATAKYAVLFKPSGRVAEVPEGTTILDAARLAGVDLAAPCGGYGRCGRCRVLIEAGEVRQRETAHLSALEKDQGHALACQTQVFDDVTAFVEAREVRLRPRAEMRVDKIALPAGMPCQLQASVAKLHVVIEPPSLEDNTSDVDRLRRALAAQHGIAELEVDLPMLRELPVALRKANWDVTAVVAIEEDCEQKHRLLGVQPGDTSARHYGIALDIGTTTVVVYLVDLLTGKVVDVSLAYNGQISCGDDVISRIIYSQRGSGAVHLQNLVVKSINDLLAELATNNNVDLNDIYDMSVAGNTTMIHLFLGINAKYIREEPYIPAMRFPPVVSAGELDIKLNPRACVFSLAGVGSYVGGDITAGVLSSGMFFTDKLTLFIDVGTNGEIVLGNADWLITCACSAGPAFEGNGVEHGMRAVTGAIEEVWIDTESLEPLGEEHVVRV